MTSGSCPITFDPLSPEQLADPYGTYAHLRDTAPLHYDAAHDLWVASRYDDVVAIATRPEDFSSADAIRTSMAPPPEPVPAVLERGIGHMVWMTSSDDPDHHRVRALVNRVFTPKRVRDLEPRLADLVDELVDGFAAEGQAEVIERFGWPMPLWGLAEIMGLPRADLPDLHRWSYDMLRLLQATDPPEALVGYAEHYVALQHYVLDALRAREHHPGDDLLSALIDAQAGADQPLSLVELAWVPINLIVAGHVTVTRAIGNGLALLFDHPGVLEGVRRRGAVPPGLVEEILRYESPAQGLFRTVTHQVTLAGVTLPAGARVMIHFGSANRDPAAFRDPDRFDAEREDVHRHLAFGKGVHHCVGAPLARSELRLAFEGLVQRLPGLRPHPDRPPVRDRIFFARGWSEMWVRWDPSDGRP